MDTRIKATVTSTMYDMSRVNANGYFDAMSEDDRYALKQKLNAQRTEDFKSGTYAKEAGLPDKLTGEEPQFVKDYWNYYKTPRGYHKQFKKFQHRLEHDLCALVYQYADFVLCRRNQKCGFNAARRKGTQPLFQRRRFQKAQRRQ